MNGVISASFTSKQIEWGVQNGAITKNRILPVTDLTFHKR